MTLRTTFTRRVGVVVLGVGLMSLGACSLPSSALSGSSPSGTLSRTQAAGPDAQTIALVSAATGAHASAGVSGEAAGATGGAERWELRARLLRALHATWVTEGQNGPVTHQAIRGEVTAVSATSITIKAKDDVSISFVVDAATRVRQRSDGSGKTSTIGAVSVGDRALVTGLGDSKPTAKHIIFLRVPG